MVPNDYMCIWLDFATDHINIFNVLLCTLLHQMAMPYGNICYTTLKDCGIEITMPLYCIGWIERVYILGHDNANYSLMCRNCCLQC